ncbi:LPXTG cell wall anchor domain-containing protein [Bifidobacterium dentium]|uniref:LPXTG cell wall anchor domain-containing protein n=1 Tax=Bifidobacterium dentium TaxID=1689 RepID=UPI001F5104CE|nr:LPXTG cell wall anchor domain-containing protein [Bifidobacterium dentium]
MSSKKNTTRAALAALVAAATLVSPFSAYAGEGGGGSGSGTGSGDGTAGGVGKVSWVYKDNYGTPTRDNAIAAMQSAGVKNLGGTESNKAIDDAVNNANAECVARSQAAGQSDPQCRLVSVGFVHTPGSSGDWYTGANGSLTAKQWQDAWVSSGIPNNTYNYNGTDYKTSSPFNDGSTTINSLVRRETDKAPRAFIAIVLSQYEPAPADYSLGISTQASGTVTQAGSTADVSDQITLSRNGSSISEDVTGQITLHWTGLDGTTRTASKQFTQNNGSTRSVSFGYRDLDSTWQSWPAGSFYFDVSVDKQGKMKAAASHAGASDAKESWKATTPPPSKTLTNAAGETASAPNDQIASGSLYTAHIKAQSNASQHFWLYDTIDVSAQQVRIGGTDADDLSKITVTDQAGNTVKADISVDDSQAGKRIVKAHVLNPTSGQYTLNVPQSATPTGTDYTIPDDSQACWTGDEYGNTDSGHCQSGNSEQVGKVTPSPNKVWVLDSNGALRADDPQGTNDKGSDNRTFVTGDAIGAVVNGSIPAHLLNPFTSYSITDNWTASAQWIDWNHKDQVKVYVDGKDMTDQFDITVDTANHTTTATAKSSFLAKSAMGTSARKVKLYIGGYVKQAPNAAYAAEQKKLTNKATETWNNETKPTNEPPVYVRNPKPDKVWSADQGTAATVEDPSWSNTVSADTHTFVQQDDFGVTVNGTLPKNLAKKMTSYELGDDFSKSAKYLDLDCATVTVTIDGKDATGQFDVHKENNKVWVTAKQSLLDTTYNQTADRKVRLTVKGAFGKGVLKAGQKVSLTNGDWEKWNDQSVTGNEPPVKEWSPNPDKSWVKLGTDGTWQTVIDPTESNKTGADTLKFLDGDQVASVVNGTIAADLVKVTDIKLVDDYAKADYIWDLTSDRSQIRVYEADAATDAQSSVSDIANKGRDVTDQFDITMTGTKVTATAKPEYRAAQVGLRNAKQISLLLPGVVNFANGKGAAQVRKDFKKDAGDELTFCTDPTSGAKLTNAGSEQVNNESQPTNEPYICGYIPPVRKKVIAEGSQGGANQDADSKVVYPGQKVEYRLTTKPQLPADLAYDIVTVRDTDTYDEYLIPDEQTVEVTDLSTGDQLTTADPQMGVEGDYTVTWDTANHSFTLTYSAEYVKEHWKAGTHPQVQVRFEGTVSEDAPTDREVDNQWMLTLNNSITPSNIVKNTPPKHTPSKKDTQSKTQGDASVDIDGKTMLLGDTGNYTVTLDLKQSDNAYRVYKAGITDDYDEEYVDIDQTKIEVLDSKGQDVTDRFNVQIKDGVAYVYAKTVDTYIPKKGVTVKGDPQPEDLAAYASGSDHDPLNDPSIDQSLLGQAYQVVMPYTVVKVTDGYTVKNKAIQVTNNTTVETNEVSNELKPINPSKDVTVHVGGESINGQSVYKDSTFLYQLDSSTIPANRAYPQVDQWKIVDPLNTEYDQYTGQWAVYATRDLYAGGQVIAAKGDRIAGNGFDSSKFGGDLFTATADENGQVTVEATDLYRSLAGTDNEHEHGWRAYIQCKRVKVGERIENRFTEIFNDKTLESNVVWTRTPDMTPSIHIEKYDVESGEQAGDRDDVKDALKMGGDSQEIAFKITNTSKVDSSTGEGAWYLARDLKMVDKTIAGEGEVVDLKYPDDWDTLVLKPGESVTVTGTLKGVRQGGRHTDRVKVTGTPLVECPVTDTDPFGGKNDETRPSNAVDVKDGDRTVTLCSDTKVESNTDDWSGYRPSLAQTGAAIGGMLLAAVAVGALGTGLLLARRKAAGTGPRGAHSGR